MGRLAKNPSLTEVYAEAITLPSGSSSNRPESPTIGSFRFNVTTSKLELWNGFEWRTIGTEGYVNTSLDVLTANGIDSTYGPLVRIFDPGQEKDVLVFIDSVYQIPGAAYTFNGTNTINFTSIPPFSSTIAILSGLNSTIV